MYKIQDLQQTFASDPRKRVTRSSSTTTYCSSSWARWSSSVARLAAVYKDMTRTSSTLRPNLLKARGLLAGTKYTHLGPDLHHMAKVLQRGMQSLV